MKPILSVSIDDCRVDTFRSGGKGGQNQNKRDSGVRIFHPSSGAVGVSREERSQLQNKRKAFRKMAESKEFNDWLKIKVAQISSEESIDDVVERLMAQEHLLVEVKQDGKWVRDA